MAGLLSGAPPPYGALDPAPRPLPGRDPAGPHTTLALSLPLAAALYLVGMGLNDLRDRERDRLLHPSRPLPAGRIGPRAAALALALLGSLSVVLAVLLGGAAIRCAGALLLLILVYNLLVKDRPLLAPLVMGSIRGVLVLLGGASSGAPWNPSEPLLIAAAVVSAYGALLTWLSMEEERARKAALGRRGAALLLGLVAGALTILIHSGIRAVAALAWAGFVAWTWSWSLAPLGGERPRPSLCTYRLLLGFFLLDAAILLSYDLPVPAGISAGLWLITGGPIFLSPRLRRSNR
ncbi:MAG: UbiA family prenyltransferase [Planctomycetota bacterium]